MNIEVESLIQQDKRCIYYLEHRKSSSSVRGLYFTYTAEGNQPLFEAGVY